MNSFANVVRISEPGKLFYKKNCTFALGYEKSTNHRDEKAYC